MRRMNFKKQFGLGIVSAIVLTNKLCVHIEGLTALHYGHILRYELERDVVACVIHGKRFLQIREELGNTGFRLLTSVNVYAAARATSAPSVIRGIG